MTEPQDVLAELERADPFMPHDLGCRCYPHVSQRAAIEAATQAATAEYRAALVRTPEPLDGAGLRREIEALPDGRTLVDLRREHEWARQRHAAGGYPSHEYCEACFLLAIVDRLADAPASTLRRLDDAQVADTEVIEWLREALGMDEQWAEIARGIVVLKRALAE